MKRPLRLHWPLAAAAGLAFSGLILAQEESMSYEEALEKTDPTRIGTLVRGSAEEQEALARFADFVGEMTAASMRQKVGQVYAEDAYFNDTLKELVGVAAIEEYMAHSMEATQSVRARVDDVAVSDGNYYVRWTMEIHFKELNKGQVARSVGISHLRFDRSGKIVLHKDYWDAADGLFQYLPVLGRAVRWVKGRL